MIKTCASDNNIGMVYDGRGRGAKKIYHWELLHGLGRKICKIKDWNICQTNVYGMLGVGTEGPKWV